MIRDFQQYVFVSPGSHEFFVVYVTRVKYISVTCNRMISKTLQNVLRLSKVKLFIKGFEYYQCLEKHTKTKSRVRLKDVSITRYLVFDPL